MLALRSPALLDIDAPTIPPPEEHSVEFDSEGDAASLAMPDAEVEHPSEMPTQGSNEPVPEAHTTEDVESVVSDDAIDESEVGAVDAPGMDETPSERHDHE